jgi:type IV pilus assembly protein PilY1
MEDIAMFRKLTHSAVAAALLILSHAPATADDAEIYVNQSATDVGNPAVMFTLDLRSNLNSQVCNDWAQCYPLFQRAGMLDEMGSMGPGDRPASVTFFQLLRGALKVVLAPVEGVYIGLMLNNENRNNCEGKEEQRCANGGYVAMDFQLLSVDTTSGNSDPVKDAFDGMLKSIPPPQNNQFGNYNHTYQGRELFFEFWRYLQGGRVYNGWNGFTSFDGNKGDDRTNIANEALHSDRWTAVAAELDAAGKGAAAQLLRDMNGFAPDPRAAPGGVVGNRTYRNPDYLGDCAQIYTINFLFQVSQQEADSDAAIAADIPVLASKGDFEDIIEYMNRTDLADTVAGDQKVVSYFFGDPRFTGGDGRKLDGYAQAGGTGYARELSEDPDKLVADLQNVFDQILSVSTTFTAAALPINSFDRAQLREDVFLALFQPQNKAFPADNRYWWGNVKKLRLPGLNSPVDNIELVDANGDRAISADGRIERNRLTFWTNPAAPDVQDPTRDPEIGSDNAALIAATRGFDGRSVNRGGAGHRIPTFPQAGVAVDAGPRKILYDTVGGTLAELDTSAAVVTALTSEFEVVDEADTVALIHYISGRNPADPTVPLDWLMGSAIHSRPLPINYGATSEGSVSGHDAENPLVYIAVGTNDGLFRFIRNTAPGNATDNTKDLSIHIGKEVWAFAPRATMRHARRIFLDQGDTLAALGESTVYGVDGPPVAWLEDLNGDGTITGDDRALVFFGLRRGGRAYYALDVSSPESPELLWTIDAETDADFAGLGLTFSEPAVGRLDYNNDGKAELVLIFGGGYDRRYDDETWAPSNPLGNAIYIVDAETGALVRKFSPTGMNDSIPSAPAVVDTNGDDLVDRIYVGDMGGKIWRVDMPRNTAKGDWPISLFANVGRNGVGSGVVGGVDDRRFFHKPDVVQAGAFRDTSGAIISGEFDAVITTSGDRASPLQTETQNWAFMLKDKNLGILSEPADTNILVDQLMDVTDVLAAEVDDTFKGWMLELEAIGEKGLSTPLTIGNVVFFTTYVPPGAQDGDTPICGPAEGSGRLYRVSLFNANPLRDGPINPWDTEPASRFVDLRSGGIPAEVVALPPNRILRPDLDVEPVPVTARWRTFWHLDEEPVE